MIIRFKLDIARRRRRRDSSRKAIAVDALIAPACAMGWCARRFMGSPTLSLHTSPTRHPSAVVGKSLKVNVFIFFRKESRVGSRVGHNSEPQFDVVRRRGGCIVDVGAKVNLCSSIIILLLAHGDHGHVRKYDVIEHTKVMKNCEMGQRTSSMIFTAAGCAAMTKQQHQSARAHTHKHISRGKW